MYEGRWHLRRRVVEWPQTSEHGALVSIAAQLASQQLVVVTGKGGVGKTTLAAALGRLLAAAGRRVLLLEVDPRESLHQLLGVAPSGGEILEAGPRLWLQNLQPRGVIEGLVREKVHVSMIARKIIESPVFQHFVDGAPGLREMAVLGYALRAVRGEYRQKVDLVVLDAPATGHGASMLSAPLLLGDAIGGGQIGDMAADLARFIADPARCGVVLGTLAEEMPVQETIELIALLKDRMSRPPEVVIVNALHPPIPVTKSGPPAELGPAVALWSRRREVNERELKRLRSRWKGPLAQLPLLPIDPGPALLAGLQDRLRKELDGGGADR
jgi:energy-coupling factor transporter ATP-binding protein EcfA2